VAVRIAPTAATPPSSILGATPPILASGRARPRPRADTLRTQPPVSLGLNRQTRWTNGPVTRCRATDGTGCRGRRGGGRPPGSNVWECRIGFDDCAGLPYRLWWMPFSIANPRDPATAPDESWLESASPRVAGLRPAVGRRWAGGSIQHPARPCRTESCRNLARDVG